MRIAFPSIAANALLLACGGEDAPGPDPSAPHLAFAVQPSTTTAGRVMTPAVQISVQDAAGNPVTSSDIYITITLSPPATLNGQTTQTIANGVAVFSDLSITKSGHYSLKAITAAINEATSTEFAVLPGPATSISRRGDAQVASVGSPVLNRPAVRLTDEFGNGIPGVRVTFEVLSGGGTVDGPQATTDAGGYAAVGSWRLGSSPGPNTLRATAGTFSPVIFTATAVILPTAITIEVHNDFFRSARNGSTSGPKYLEHARDTIAVGGTVTWVWLGQNHNIQRVSPYPAISLTGNQDAPFTLGPITFSSPGTVWYRCTNHSTPYDYLGMAGRILVR